MSAKSRAGSVSDPQSSYLTPGWAVDSLLSEWVPPGGGGGRWLEPCAGTGSIVRTVRARLPGIAWDACELREECREPLVAVGVDHLVIGDFLDPDFRARALLPRYDVVLTNPPYSQLSEFVNACLPLADAVAMILRLNVLEGAERAEFWRRHAADVYVLPSRPSFVGKGTDATAYAWFVWHGAAVRTHGHVRVLAPVPVDRRRAW